MVNNSNPIVAAIEIGSSKISGMVGQKCDNAFKVLSYSSVRCSDSVHYGAVYNMQKTADHIVAVIDGLEHKMNGTIDRLYLSYAGRSLHTILYTAKRSFDTQVTIDDNILDDIQNEANASVPSEYQLIYSEVQDYRINGSQARNDNPNGVLCSTIECRYQLVVIKKQYIENIQQCFDMANHEILDNAIVPLTLSKNVLTQDEREKGCALIDYGADTTTVTIYKSSRLCFIKVLPMGSNLIISDIMNHFHISFLLAESLMCTYGLYNISRKDQGKKEEIARLDDANEKKEIPLKMLGQIIAARNEEILDNVMNQITLSGYKDTLYGGVVMTGGGSNLRKMDDLIKQQYTNIYKFRIAKVLPVDIIWDYNDWKKDDGTQLGLLSLLMRDNNENCATIKEEEWDQPVDITQASDSQVSVLDMFSEAPQTVSEGNKIKRIEEFEEKSGENEDGKNKKNQSKKGLWSVFSRFTSTSAEQILFGDDNNDSSHSK